MMDKVDLWNKFKQPPAEVLRTIKGGRLAGKTDISPMWRYKVMTETLGPCGVGWKFTIDKVWSEEGAENQRFAFAIVTVFINVDGKWSDGIPGQGGSMLVEKETKGLYSSDEGYKMAITDAIGTALKMIGVAADVFMGLWDGSKYLNAPSNITNYVRSLIACDTMDKLKGTFQEIYNDFRDDPDAMATLTKIKDMMKVKLEAKP